MIGILGGTFDPVHGGHLAVALAARDALGLDVVMLVPTRCRRTDPRQPYASIYHRFAMTALAALSAEGLQVSDLELDTPGPSYTSMLLDRLHGEGHDASHIVFIIGADAFAEIATWHNYPAILNRCHFAVISRPGQQADELRARLPDLADRFVTITPETRAPNGAASPSLRCVGVTRTSDFSDRCGDAERFFYRDPRAAARRTPDRRAGTRGGRAVHPAARVICRAGAVPTAGHLHEHKAQ